MQNDRNYPMVGSLFISKSHVRSRRALDGDGADTAENEPLEDYRLRIQQPAAAKDAALHRAVRGAA